MKKYYDVNCFFFDGSGRPHRGKVPEKLRFAKPTNTRTSLGNYLCGTHRGKKWGYVKTYSIWSDEKGICRGEEYTAYDLRKKLDRECFQHFEGL